MNKRFITRNLQKLLLSKAFQNQIMAFEIPNRIPGFVATFKINNLSTIHSRFLCFMSKCEI